MILVILLAGLSGCLLTDPESITESALRENLEVQVERYLATDHIWQSHGPRTPVNEESIYLFVYMRLLNTGDTDLPMSDVLIFAYFLEGSAFYSPFLIALGGYSLEDDPRLREGHLDTIDAVIPPDETLEGWVWFTTDNSTLMEGHMQLRLSYIVDENRFLRRDLSLDDVEEDWGIPAMVTVDEERLTYTDMNMGSWVDYGERYFVADLSLVNNWPVNAHIYPEDINITDAQGAVQEPETIGGRTPRDVDPIEFNGSYQLKVAFMITTNEIPVSLSLAEDPPMVLKIDPGSIIEDKYPPRVDLTVNFFFEKVKNDRSFLIYNLSLNNTSDEIVSISVWSFNLLDKEGTLHSIRWGPMTTENELVSQDLEPGEDTTGEVPFNLLADLEPVSLVFHDEPSYLEIPHNEVMELTQDIRPRLTFEIEVMNITSGNRYDPWTEFFNVSVRVWNLLPFEVPLRSHNFTLYDSEGRSYRAAVNPPVERGEMAFYEDLGPGESVSGSMRFTVQNDATLTLLEYKDEGQLYKLTIDHDSIEVRP